MAPPLLGVRRLILKRVCPWDIASHRTCSESTSQGCVPQAGAHIWLICGMRRRLGGAQHATSTRGNEAERREPFFRLPNPVSAHLPDAGLESKGAACIFEDSFDLNLQKAGGETWCDT